MQHLLTCKADTPSPSSDVIDEHLVTFNSSRELQEQNAELLKIVRRLSNGRQVPDVNMSSAGVEGSLAAALEIANRELAGLRETRMRTEEMVSGLVQQRDMYRCMLEEAEKTASGVAATLSPLKLSRRALEPSDPKDPDAQRAVAKVRRTSAKLRFLMSS